MTLLKKALEIFFDNRKKNKGTGGSEYNKYISSNGGFQTFRTSQDFKRKRKPFFLKRLTERLIGSKRKNNDSGYSVTNINEQRPSFAFLKIFSLIILLCCVGYVSKDYFWGMVYGLKYFHIQNIEIKGCRITNQLEIRERGDFSYGTSLFKVDPAERVALLKKHTWIENAVVKRKWPDRLQIIVKEFTPEAMVAQGKSGEDSLFYVNKKGVCFTPVKPGEDVDYPVITGLDILDKKKERGDALGDALHFLKLARMNNPNLPAQLVSEINIDEKEGMVIYLVEHPFPIYFGRDDVTKKYRQLRKVLEMLYKKQKSKMKITQVMYIRMDYLTNKVLVAQSGSG